MVVMKANAEVKEGKPETNLSLVRDVLSNTPLIKWAKAYTPDHLEGKEKVPKDFSEFLKCGQNTLTLMDAANVKMLCTDTKFEGKPLALFSMGELKEIISLCGSEGRLIVVKGDFPCVVETETGENTGRFNCVVLAPRVSD